MLTGQFPPIVNDLVYQGEKHKISLTTRDGVGKTQSIAVVSFVGRILTILERVDDRWLVNARGTRVVVILKHLEHNPFHEDHPRHPGTVDYHGWIKWDRLYRRWVTLEVPRSRKIVRKSSIVNNSGHLFGE